MLPKLISLKEASGHIGLTIHALRKWIRLRRLPYHRVGGRVMFDETDIEAFIEGTRVQGKDEWRSELGKRRRHQA